MSIAGTYFGLPVEGGIANVRDTGSVVAGLLGGPLVGAATGLISGPASHFDRRVQRCGLWGGDDNRRRFGWLYPPSDGPQKSRLDWLGVVTGVGVILFSMGLILAISPPFPAAWSLVSSVAVPMSLANALGIAVFMIITQNAKQHQTNIGGFPDP